MTDALQSALPNAIRPGRYGVVGNPVAHSLSPQIHAAFAKRCGTAVDYRRIVAPKDGFAKVVDDFFADDGDGLNVTLPFKLEAFAACGDRLSARARLAGAVNTLSRDAHGLFGDNTDGVGLVRDLSRVGGAGSLHGARLLLIGAGGAARGVVAPLLESGLRAVVVVNRDAAKAASLVREMSAAIGLRDGQTLEARGLDTLDAPFDIVVNATSAGLSGERVPMPASWFTGVRLAYDMTYGAGPSVFLVAAREAGARTIRDGLGMLVEQAAESWFGWHGTRPETGPVLDDLRSMLDADRR